MRCNYLFDEHEGVGVLQVHEQNSFFLLLLLLLSWLVAKPKWFAFASRFTCCGNNVCLSEWGRNSVCICVFKFAIASQKVGVEIWEGPTSNVGLGFRTKASQEATIWSHTWYQMASKRKKSFWKTNVRGEYELSRAFVESWGRSKLVDTFWLTLHSWAVGLIIPLHFASAWWSSYNKILVVCTCTTMLGWLCQIRSFYEQICHPNTMILSSLTHGGHQFAC